jgi:hypothetical protein
MYPAQLLLRKSPNWTCEVDEAAAIGAAPLNRDTDPVTAIAPSSETVRREMLARTDMAPPDIPDS